MGNASPGIRSRLLVPAMVLLAFASRALGAEPQPAEPVPATWNPWGKESPEPYGYDVYSAPDIPPGTVNPADPPDTLATPPPRDPLLAVLAVVTTLDRTAYSWFGDITVTAEVRRLGVLVPDCDSVVVVSAANPRVRARLADDGVAPDAVAADGRYTGVFEVGAGEGEARPTGSYTVTASAWRAAETGSANSPNFSLYSVRRWTGITTTGGADPGDTYTAFQVTPNGPGAGWHHVIRDFGLIRSTSVNNAQIRIPVLPRTAPLTGLTVTGAGVSGVQLRDNVIAFDADLTSGTVKRVTIEFDAAVDLAAVLIDRYQTGDIGLRDFRNGYLVWNRFIHTAIMGSGFSSPHGPGCIVDLHVTDLVTGAPHSVDCMERVAVHLDNAAFNDGTGTYPSNIKWGGDALSWLESAEAGSLRFRFFSGGAYGLQSKVAVEREVEFTGESRLFRHRYVVRNVDAVSHDFDFVWGREQWLYGSAPGSDRQEDDRGILPNDAGSWGGEFRYAPAQVDGNWFAAFDRTSFYTIGVVAADGSADAMPSYAYFLCDPPLGNFTGEYPINPAGACADMPNIFFEKPLGVLAPGDSAVYEFRQWGGYGGDREELTEVMWRDAVAVSGEPLAMEYAPLGDAVPVTAVVEVRFNNPMNRASTEAAFALSPPAAGTFEWEDGDRLMRFLPAAALVPETIYHAEVLRTATDQAGDALVTAASWFFETGAVATEVAGGPAGVVGTGLRAIAPNPFKGVTEVRFVLAEEGRVSVTVVDVRGRLVATLADAPFAAGEYVVGWRGQDSDGTSLPSGVYFCRLDAAGQQEVRKVVLRGS